MECIFLKKFLCFMKFLVSIRFVVKYFLMDLFCLLINCFNVIFSEIGDFDNSIFFVFRVKEFLFFFNEWMIFLIVLKVKCELIIFNEGVSLFFKFGVVVNVWIIFFKLVCILFFLC